MRRLLGIAAALLVARARTAGAGPHPRFEPTDLEIEQPGVTELDLQVGAVKGPGASRIVVPDFELDVGIMKNFELDLDGALGAEGAGHTVLFDHLQRDNLWASAKVGLFDHVDEVADRAYGLGLQVGPKLPVGVAAHGIGIEGVLLLGYHGGPWHLVLELGGLDDPHSTGAKRPVGAEAGLDLEYEIVDNRWSFLGEAGGVWYRSSDASQLALTAGIQFSPNDHLDLSVVALVGILSGSDPYGLLLGISPKFKLW